MRTRIIIPSTTVTSSFNFNIVFGIEFESVLDADSFNFSNITIHDKTGRISNENLGHIDCAEALVGSSICLPEECFGEFELGLVGEVNIKCPDGTITQEKLAAISQHVRYDTRTKIVAHLGKPSFEDCVVKQPITFDSDVFGMTKKIFGVIYSGGRCDVSVFGSGNNRNFTICVNIPKKTEGIIKINPIKKVLTNFGKLVKIDIGTVEIPYSNK